MNTYTEKVKEAAIAAFPMCIEIVKDILWRGQSCGADSPQKAAAEMAVRYGYELVNQLNKFNGMSPDERKENYGPQKG